MHAPLPPLAGLGPEEQREAVYQLYRAGGERSLRKTAEACGIPEGTLMSWSLREGWQERLARDDAEARERMRADALRQGMRRATRALEVAEQLMTDPATPGHVRLDAARFLAGLEGFTPAQRADLRVTAQPPVPEATLAELRAMTPEELAARQRARVAAQERR